MSEQRTERIEAGRIKHGVGQSGDFPENVCHLVSPIVGHLRLRQRDGSSNLPNIGHIIDRLSLVVDMAYEEAERVPTAPPTTDRAADGDLGEGEEG